MKAIKFFVLVLLALMLTLTLQATPKASSYSKLEEVKPATALYAIDFVNETIGFTCGSIGIMLKTTDGGENWNILEWAESGNMSIELFDISFIDENNGWIAGAYMNPSNGFGFIMHTNDSGLTWTYQYIKDSWDIKAIDMVNSTYGWAVGSHYRGGYGWELFYKTENGIDWELYQGAPNVGWELFDVCVLDPATVDTSNYPFAFACGTEGHVWYLWNNIWYETHAHTGGMLQTIHFINETHGWTIDQLYGRVYVTNNSIHNFHRTATLDTPLTDISFYNGTLGWLCTARGQIYITIDAGLTWNLDYLVTGTEPCLRALDVTHSTPKVWVVGGQTAKAFGGRADLATIVHKSSPWETQLCPTMIFELPYNETIYNVYMEADSTLTNFVYNMTGDTFYFKVFGPDTCTGCCNITVPKEIVKGNIQVNIDGTTILDATITDNATHYFVSITYHHSIHDIDLNMNYWMKPDLNHDNIINIYDVIMVTGIYGSREGDPNFNATRDLYTDGIINIYDVVQVTGRYGETL